jgi:hypothetical protein
VVETSGDSRALPYAERQSKELGAGSVLNHEFTQTGCILLTAQFRSFSPIVFDWCEYIRPLMEVLWVRCNGPGAVFITFLVGFFGYWRLWFDTIYSVANGNCPLRSFLSGIVKREEEAVYALKDKRRDDGEFAALLMARIALRAAVKALESHVEEHGCES